MEERGLGCSLVFCEDIPHVSIRGGILAVMEAWALMQIGKPSSAAQGRGSDARGLAP